MHQYAQHHKAKIVVVEHTACKPWIIRRERRTTHHRRQKRQVHWLFATTTWMPQIGITGAYPHKCQKGQHKHHLGGDNQPAPLCPKASPCRTVAPPTHAGSSHPQQRQYPHPDPPIIQGMHGACQPNHPRNNQQSECFGDSKTTIGQPAQGPPEQHKRCQTQYFDGQPPPQPRHSSRSKRTKKLVP